MMSQASEYQVRSSTYNFMTFLFQKRIQTPIQLSKKDEDGNLFDADYSKAAYDLALLSNCNHTIVSRGTYSLWGKYFWFKNFLNCKYFIFTYLLLFIFLVAMLAGGEYYTEYGAIVPPHLQG